MMLLGSVRGGRADGVAGPDEGHQVVALHEEKDLMKKKFAKLLRGEDICPGPGKMVPSALALSIAVTNLAASVFGEQWKLEPMAPDRKGRWKKEVWAGFCLPITSSSSWPQRHRYGGLDRSPSSSSPVLPARAAVTLSSARRTQLMGTHQRRDLQANTPALRKLDTMLLDYLDNFKERNEFWYVKRDSCSESENEERANEKWWIPIVNVPPGGLSPTSRAWLLHQKPEGAGEPGAQGGHGHQRQLHHGDEHPGHIGRASLGDALYRVITDVEFDPDDFLSTMDLTSEHKILDLKDRIEAGVGHHLEHEGAQQGRQVVLGLHRQPGEEGAVRGASAEAAAHPQAQVPRHPPVRARHRKDPREQGEQSTSTSMRATQCNAAVRLATDLCRSGLNALTHYCRHGRRRRQQDVGFALLESYSRVLESLAFNVMSRIEDVVQTDNLARDIAKKNAPPAADPAARRRTTLLDFMGWNRDARGMERGRRGQERRHVYADLLIKSQ
ncbi:Rho guanine nucleotide exchange factor 8 [Zea mays]|uniref:Rho guanine nucleotide exchange factor 8 n=1 Tax=Zea mays TaxID=4577 RepID=A0A3L6DU85_MAIZE|nr:Rho guanine nucleotide exchange factor 8 [Zea mays]